jgi:hypothetical protein
MANSKISALPSATTPLAGTEVLPVVQGGITEQVSVANLTAGRDVSASGLFVDANSATSAIRVTQLGAGNALLVEDSANPDATPFVIDASGVVINGYTATVATQNYGGSAITAALYQQHGNSQNTSTAAVFNWSSSAASPANLILNKSISNVVGTRGALTATNTDLGTVTFNGDDGTNFIPAATILAEVDNTPGLNDMPGRLVFSTTSDGASTPTERVRISSAGVTTFTGTGIINANTSTDALRITQLGAGNALLVEDSANPDATPFVVDAAGNTFIGYGTSLAPSAVSGCEFQVNSVGTTQASILAAQWGVNSTGSAQILLAHSLSGVRGTQSIVSSGAALGKIRSFGSDGTNFIEATSIESYVDGTPGTNDMPGKLVFSTTADGASSVTERVRIDSVGNTYVETGVLWQYAPAPTAKAALATLTAAELQTGILSTTGTTYTITLPTGTAIDAGFTSVPTTGIGFDWYVVNTATGIITIAVGASGMTSLGALTVAIGASAHFRFRRTAANTYVLYRLS